MSKETDNSTKEIPLLYVILVLVRFLWTFISQRGYLHPDEFFQGLEIVSGDMYECETYRSWEFNMSETSKPIRNIAIPYLIYGVPLQILNIFVNNLHLVKLDSYTLLLFPRLAMTALSLVGDYSLYRLSVMLKMDVTANLMLFSTSYITLVYLTHTFSNSIETALFSILLYLIISSTKSNNFNKYASLIGLVTCIGVFNRPTFVLFSVAPLVYLFLQHYQKSKGLFDLLKFLSLLKYAVPALILFVTIDTFYYQNMCIYDLDKLLSSDFILSKLIITPLNFFIYNTNTSNLSEHGIHPFYQHLLINSTLLFGINHFILIYYALFKYKSITTTFRFVLCAYFIPLILFSFISHQEARFLLPLLIPLCLITSKITFGEGNQWSVKYFWIIMNVFLAIIYGVYHQGAVVSSLSYVQNMFVHPRNFEIDQHVIYYHTYMPPRYLVNVPMSKAGVNATRKLYDLMSPKDGYLAIESQVDQIRSEYKSNGKSVGLFLITPLACDEQLCLSKKLHFQPLVSFGFHVQFEDFGKHLDLISCKYETCNYKCENLNLFERFIFAFSLNFYQITV